MNKTIKVFMFAMLAVAALCAGVVISVDIITPEFQWPFIAIPVTLFATSIYGSSEINNLIHDK